MKRKQTKQSSGSQTSLKKVRKKTTLFKKKTQKINKNNKLVVDSIKEKATAGEPQGKSGKKSDSAYNKKRKSNNETSAGGLKKKKGEKSDEEEVKLQKKDLKVSRRKKKQNYELTVSLIKKYDALRRRDISNDKKKVIVDEVLDMIAGHGHEVVFKHDTVRVIQMCLKYGSEEQRTKFFEQFKDSIADLALKTYSKFFVKKMIKYGSKEQRNYIVNSFHRKVKKYVRHKEGVEIIDTIYSEYANSGQRKFLLQEFYGAEFAIGKVKQARSLEEILTVEPHKKPAIIRNLKETLSSLIDKSLLTHSIVHKALLDFFVNADEKERADMIEAVREQLVTILHTYEGARVAMMSIWHGNPKDRKIIVKSFKTYVQKICKEEYGHLTLLALFDCVDDTVLVQKTILTELSSCLDDIIENHYGRKVLFYLLSPRSPSYFAPNILTLLSKGDGNQYSKKETSVRRSELLSGVSSALMTHVVENTKAMMFDKPLSQLFIAVAQNIKEDIEPIMNSVVKLVMKDFDPTTDDEDHVIKSASGHFVVKRLIQLDKERIDEGSRTLFSPLLMARLDPEMLFSFCKVNRGAFVVVSLLECHVKDVKEEVEQSLKPCLQQLKKISNKGVEIILKLLEKT